MYLLVLMSIASSMHLRSAIFDRRRALIKNSMTDDFN